MPNNKHIALALVAGVAIGGIAMGTFQTSTKPELKKGDENAKAPLYWVAPMDDSYRRDKPGKSPMGMDLVPVYEKPSKEQSTDGSVVTISPSVINNLGVRTQAVESGSLNQTIQTMGYVQFDEDKLVHIHPRVSGWLDALFVKASGVPVNKGQALYTLYSPELVNAQEEYLIALKRQNTQLIEAAKSRLKALQLSADFIQALAQNREVKQNVTFYAPQDGVVDKLSIREGFYVEPGTTLMSIAKLDSVWVEASIFEQQAPFIALGQPVTIATQYQPHRQWSGTVDYIYPTLDPKTRTVRLRVALENPDEQLKPNMFVSVAISQNQPLHGLLLPSDAVIRTGRQNRVVKALGDGKFTSVPVELGREVNNNVEVLAGLKVGEHVVTSAQFLIDSESSKAVGLARMDTDSVPEQVEQMEHSGNNMQRMNHEMDGRKKKPSQMSPMDHNDHKSMQHENMEGHE